MADTTYYDRILSIRRETDREPWIIEYRSKEADASVKRTVFVATSSRQEGDRYETYSPGDELAQILTHLEKSIQRFPYIWPWEGEVIDAYGFDLLVGEQEVNLPLIPYTILVDRLHLDPLEQNRANDAVAQNTEYLEGVGAYCRFTITLQQTQEVSDISLVPFTVYPMEVVSITYVPDTESYHVPKELVGPYDVYRDTDTIQIHFEPVRAKALTFVVRQKNYNKTTYQVSPSGDQQELFWQAMQDQELRSMLHTDVSTDTSELPAGVRQAMKRYEESVHEWNRQMEAYQAYQQEQEGRSALDEDIPRVRRYQQKLRTFDQNMQNWDERGRSR